MIEQMESVEVSSNRVFVVIENGTVSSVYSDMAMHRFASGRLKKFYKKSYYEVAREVAIFNRSKSSAPESQHQ